MDHLVSTDSLNAFHYRAHNYESIVLDKCAGGEQDQFDYILCIMMTFTLTNGSKGAGESIHI